MIADPMINLLLLRFYQLANNFRLLRNTGRFRLFIAVFVLLVVWAGIFLGFYRAFIFLHTFMGVGEILIDRLIYLLTFALFIMLVFSNTVISFQLFFKAKETFYLLTLPLSPHIIFKFLVLEGGILSTWATIFLIFPVVLAYGITHKISIYAYISLPVFAIGLAALATLIGVLIASLIPWFLSGSRLKKFLILVLIFLFGIILFQNNFTPASQTTPNRQTLMINQLLEHSRITLSPIFPGFWAAEGFIQGVKGRLSRSLGFLTVLIVNALLAGQIVNLTAERSYLRSWSVFHSRRPRREKIRIGFKSPIFTRLSRFFSLSSPTGAIVIKDIKTFIREPAQWLQAVILFGLLTIYILNIKNMPRNVYQSFWKNIITFFNLGATSLILATLSSRFVYPSLSLEGRTFWMLGLAPITRSSIFKTKLWSNFIASVIITVPLIILSNHILEVSLNLTVVTCITIVLMAGVLVSLANSLGAIFAQFTEDNPSRIASGFGGTINLVISLIYIGVVVGSLALAYHMQNKNLLRHYTLIPETIFIIIVILSILGSYLLCRIGIRALDRMEF